MRKIVFSLLTFILFACSRESALNDGVEKLVWYTIGTPQNDLKLVLKEVNKYLEEKINANLEIKMIDWGDYSQKIQVIQASGEEFDLVFTSSWANDYRQNATRGAFYPLNELLDEYGEGIKRVLHPAFLEGTKINGVSYAIPANKEVAEQLMFRINKTYLDKYNLDASKINSAKDLESFLEVIKQNESDVVPFAVYGNSHYLLDGQDYLINSRVPGMIRIEDATLTVRNQYEDEDFLKEIRLYRKYYERGYIPKDAAQVPDNPFLEKTGKWFVSRVSYQPYAEILWEKANGYKSVVRPSMKKPLISTRSVSGSMVAISSTSQKRELAMKFLNLLNTDVYLRNLLDFGIEGVHYKFIDNEKGIVDLIEGAKYDMPSFSLGNIFLLYTYPEDPIDKWQQFEKFNNSASRSPILGFVFDPTPVKNELASVVNVAEEFGPALSTGAQDLDKYLPKALEKFKLAGSIKVIQEMQRQIDAWAKANHKK